jgi:hypothetical protein
LILNFFMYFTLHISTSLSRDGTPHMLQILTHFLHFSETLDGFNMLSIRSIIFTNVCIFASMFF